MSALAFAQFIFAFARKRSRLFGAAAFLAGLSALGPRSLEAYVDVPKMNLPELGQQKEAPEPTPAQRALEKLHKLKEDQQAYSQRKDWEYLEYLERKLDALEKGDKKGLVSAKQCWAIIPSSETKSWRKAPLPPEDMLYIGATQDKAAAKKEYEERVSLGEGIALLLLKECQGFTAGPERAELEFDLFFAKKSKVVSATE